LFLSARRLSLILATVLLVGTVGHVAELRAQEKLPATVAAVIDYDKVRRESKAGKSIRDQIEARRKAYQSQLDVDGKRLLTQDTELQKQRSVLSAQAFQDKKQALDAEARRVQRDAQMKLQQLGDVSQIALGQLEQAFIQILDGLSSDRGFNVVLPRSAVLVFSPKIDLTDDVMARLDKMLPTIKVPDKAPDQPKK
jgi:Skp family chaperone for outer membrane proteins